MLGVVTIAFSLFAFGLFGLVAINIRKALDQVEERVEVRAFISDSTEIEAVVAAMKDIGDFPEVARVDYVSKEQALDRARQALGEFVVTGPKTNLAFHAELLNFPEFISGDYDTSVVSRLRP